MKLLFSLAYWHSLAGLHLHTDDTVDLLDQCTTALGERLRQFKATTCEAYITRESKREAERRKRRAAKSKKAKAGLNAVEARTRKGKAKAASEVTPATDEVTAAADEATAAADEPKLKSYSGNTYKIHALGDYVSFIRRIGTTDSYTSRGVWWSCFAIAIRRR